MKKLKKGGIKKPKIRKLKPLKFRKKPLKFKKTPKYKPRRGYYIA